MEIKTSSRQEANENGGELGDTGGPDISLNSVLSSQNPQTRGSHSRNNSACDVQPRTNTQPLKFPQVDKVDLAASVLRHSL